MNILGKIDFIAYICIMIFLPPYVDIILEPMCVVLCVMYVMCEMFTVYVMYAEQFQGRLTYKQIKQQQCRRLHHLSEASLETE